VNPTAFTSSSSSPSGVLDALAAAGFEIGPPRALRRTVVDTFDGRLHRAGLRLEVRGAGNGAEVVLDDGRSSPARAPAATAPRRAADLPAGPLRSRLGPVLDVRALVPLATVTATVRPAVRRDAEGTARVTVDVHDGLAVDGAPVGPPWAAELRAGAGYAKDAASARALLRSLGLKAGAGDVLDQALAAAGVARRGFTGSPTIALAADEPALPAFRRVLANLMLAVDANWQGTVDDVDPEFLHDLRVAVRRTRSVLAQGRRVLPADVRATYREAFGWLGGVTGPSRDLDVYGIEWERYVGPLGPDVAADLEPVRRHIESLRSSAHAELSDVLRSERYREVTDGWRAWLAGAGPVAGAGRDAGRAIGKVAAGRIRDAQAQVLERGRGISAATPAEELHQLRKDAKKLRYLLECFGGLYAPAPRKAFVQRLKALQDNLGQHQDAEVHVAQLEEIAAGLPEGSRGPATLVALGRLSESIDRARRSARQEFAGRFRSYDTRATARSLDALLDSSP
jgi:CHAD domain-containing protein